MSFQSSTNGRELKALKTLLLIVVFRSGGYYRFLYNDFAVDVAVYEHLNALEENAFSGPFRVSQYPTGVNDVSSDKMWVLLYILIL